MYTTNSKFLLYLVKGAYYIFPNFEKFNIRNSAIAGIGISGDQILFTILYGLAYIIIALMISNYLLKKQEFWSRQAG